MWLTLFRSVEMHGGCEWGWNIEGDEALEAGVNRYEYSLYPYAGTWDAAAVPQASMEVNTPIFARKGPRQSGCVEPEASLLSVEPRDLVQVSWRPADVVPVTTVRIYNPTDAPIEGMLTAGFDIKWADETNFREERTAKVTIDDNRIALSFGPYEIKTVRLAVAEE